MRNVYGAALLPVMAVPATAEEVSILAGKLSARSANVAPPVSATRQPHALRWHRRVHGVDRSWHRDVNVKSKIRVLSERY